MNKKKIVLISSIVAILIILTIILILANKGHRMIVAESYEGNIALLRSEKQLDVFKGIHLASGDKVNVNSDSLLALLLDEDKHMIAEANTEFEIIESGSVKKGLIDIRLTNGKTLITIDNKLPEDSKFEVHTPNVALSVRGTSFLVDYTPATRTTYIEVYEGTVWIGFGNEEKILNAGDHITIQDELIVEDVAYLEEQEIIDDSEDSDDILLYPFLGETDIEVGDSVYFGNYQYGAILEVEPMLWDVIDMQDGMALLISHYTFRPMYYYKQGQSNEDVVSDTNWEESNVRYFLNNDFYEEAFSVEERNRIIEVTIDNPTSDVFFETYIPIIYNDRRENSAFRYEENTNPCGETNDKIFLLSMNEVEKYYGPLYSDELHAYATNATCVTRSGGDSEWLLRSQGSRGYRSLYIMKNEFQFEVGVSSDSKNSNKAYLALRPAMWVEL